MKSQVHKQLALIALMFSLIFIATGVTAKKPIKPPPDDPCASLHSPDFVFWRDSTSKRVPQVTIYVAESATGCEKKLLDIPLADTGPINDLKLAYSSANDEGLFFGRVVWARQITGHAISVWKYDFHIEQGSVIGVGEPTMILENTDFDNQDINDLDLSPDTHSLVYRLREYGNPDIISIRTIHIADCIGTCTFDAGVIVYFIKDIDIPGSIEGLRSPVWGPLGNRIYFVERETDFYHLKAIDSSGGNPITLLTIGRTELGIVRQISSGIGYGWPDEKEYIAVTIGPVSFAGMAIHGCANIYLLDVAGCYPSGDGCDLKHQFAGIWPSWTRDGKLIHTYQGLTLKKVCKTDTVGFFDGFTLGTLTKGYEPEAAGG